MLFYVIKGRKYWMLVFATVTRTKGGGLLCSRSCSVQVDMKKRPMLDGARLLAQQLISTKVKGFQRWATEEEAERLKYESEYWLIEPSDPELAKIVVPHIPLTKNYKPGLLFDPVTA